MQLWPIIFLLSISVAGFLLKFSLLCAVSSAMAMLVAYYLVELFLVRRGTFLDVSSYLLPDDWIRDLKPVGSSTRQAKAGADHKPWHSLSLPKHVDTALQSLLDKTLETHVHSWYFAYLSEDAALLTEIRYQLRFVLANLYHLIENVDLSELIMAEAVPVCVSHVSLFVRVSSQTGASASRAALEQRVLDGLHSGDLHCALYNRDTELAYLRKVAELVLMALADHNRLAGWPDHQPNAQGKWHGTPRHFVRELLVFAILMPLLDLLAEPHTLNDLLQLLFSPDPINWHQEAPSDRVPFLAGLGQCDRSSDSLLQLNLSDIMRQPNTLYLLMTHMKDTNGPLNQLQFVLAVSHLQQQFGRERAKTGSCGEADMAHVHYECWELYKTYLHDQSAEFLPVVPANMLQAFKLALELSPQQAGTELEQQLDSLYQCVYRQLQQEHVLPFCQSEFYLRSVAGDRPVTGTNQSRPHTPAMGRSTKRSLAAPVDPTTVASGSSTSSVTMSRVRGRFRSLFGVQVEDGTPNLHNNLHMSAVEAVDEDVAAGAEEDYLLDEEDEIEVDVPSIDLSEWTVTVPKIEPRRDKDGRTMYVYVVTVQHNDLSSDHPLFLTQVDRRYNEFYVLESKLLEFHGEDEVAPFLPQKKPFTNKGRAFIESMRPSLDSFVQRLSQNETLRYSQLMAAFLTSNEEFRGDFIPNVFNPLRGMKKVGVKLTRERGQHLQGFIEDVCVGALCNGPMQLTPSPSHNVLSPRINGRMFPDSDSISQSSQKSSLGPVHDTLYQSVFANNYGSAAPPKLSASMVDEQRCRANGLWQNVYDLVLLALINVWRIGTGPIVLLVALRGLVRNTLHTIIECGLRRVLRLTLHELTVTELIELTERALYGQKDTPSNMAEHKRHTELLARQRAQDLLLGRLPTAALILLGGEQGCAQGLTHVMDCIQLPR